MKSSVLKIVVIFLICCFYPAKCFALWNSKYPHAYYYDNPPPVEKPKKDTSINLNRPPIGVEQEEVVVEPTKWQKIKKENKLLKKLPESKKVTVDNAPNKAAKTVEEYDEISKEIKRVDRAIPEIQFTRDEKLVNVGEPTIKIVRYNDPPGSYNLNLTGLTKSRRVNSDGVLSPDETKLVYSSAYYYQTERQVASEIYLVSVNPSYTTMDKIKYSHELNQVRKPLLATGIDYIQREALKTLVLLDWSTDSKRIAVKERIGSSVEGIWQTNLYVYDFETQKSKKLNEVREAIRYYWKQNNIDLIDYMWDIYPVGWDELNPERIIVYAYGYTDSVPKFLGTWSIDYKGERSLLMSLKDTNFAVSTNGLMLKAIIRE